MQIVRDWRALERTERTFSTSPGTVRKLVTLSVLTPSSVSISTALTSSFK